MRIIIIAVVACALGATSTLAKDKDTILADMLRTTYLNKPVSLWLKGWDTSAGHAITNAGTLTAVGSDYITVKSGDGLHTYPMSAILQIY
jgi:hypothetical protein